MGNTKANLTEEQVTEITLSSLKENPEGVTEYPILEFDDRALRLLSSGVAETLRYSEVKPRGGLGYRFVKRLFDIVVSSLGLILLAIPMGVVALVIYLDDKGSPIFSQARLTENGKVFRMHKFRSMCVDAEKKFAEVQKENETDGLAFKSENDPRITKIGRFIRKASIDELPQLFNILKGEMSFIGPRPERPQIIREYIEEMPEFAYRTRVKAGLAGYAQVYGKYNTTPYDKLKLDPFYIENYSVWLDLKLMLLTLKILFTPDSTEGVDEKQVTAMKKQVQEEEK